MEMRIRESTRRKLNNGNGNEVIHVESYIVCV
jgi:hypothetical protein